MSDNELNMKATPASDVDTIKWLMEQVNRSNEQETKLMANINKLMRHIFELKSIPNMYGDVKTFIEACDQPRSEENGQLYRGLMSEEYTEFMDAYHNVDKVEELDACMDLIWVTLGYCYMNGWDVEGAWHEVARSNLSKINPETGKVIKREDGKVLKPEGWTPPSLEQFTK